MPDTDVLVVGAGPTGLMLANELDLAGARVIVVEKAPRRTGQSKALAVQPRSAEILDARGWLDPLRPYIHATIPAGHFAGLLLDYATLDTRFPHQIAIEQAKIEELLEDRLTEAVLRGHSCVDVRQDTTSVTATVETNGGRHEITARYLVAADGGHSAVRRLLDIPFPGRDARMRLGVADITLNRKPAGLADEWALPEFGAGGLGYLLPLGQGIYRVLFSGVEQQGVDRAAEITRAEVQRALVAVHGPEVEVGEVRWASRFSDASRQVQQYRDGRVFFAGDAAHIHLPAGGQGLNLGIQDAVNLGWKLAAAVGGRASVTLLDSYHDERHPIAARVLVNTRAQGVLTVPDPDIVALREVFGDLLAQPDANRIIAGEVSGIDIQYPMPCGTAHALLGSRAPDIELTTDTGPVRLHQLLRSGQPVLLDPSDLQAARTVAAPWADRVRHVPAVIEFPAVLIRPDGYVCWVAPAGKPIDGLVDALTHWFGPAGRSGPPTAAPPEGEPKRPEVPPGRSTMPAMLSVNELLRCLPIRDIRVRFGNQNSCGGMATALADAEAGPGFEIVHAVPTPPDAHQDDQELIDFCVEHISVGIRAELQELFGPEPPAVRIVLRKVFPHAVDANEFVNRGAGRLVVRDLVRIAAER